MNGKRLFLIEKDGATVSWCPDDVEVQKNYGSKLWESLVKQLKNRFGKITINQNTLKYHQSTNVIKLHNNTGDKLNKKSIENYCNLLKSSRNSIRMYFYIGDTAPHGDVYDEDGDDGNKNDDTQSDGVVYFSVSGDSGPPTLDITVDLNEAVIKEDLNVCFAESLRLWVFLLFVFVFCFFVFGDASLFVFCCRVV